MRNDPARAKARARMPVSTPPGRALASTQRDRASAATQRDRVAGSTQRDRAAARSFPRLTLERGYSFVELIIVTTIVLILASAVQPLAKVAIQRQKEAELRRVLREMRTAIDKFKDAADAQLIPPTELRAGGEGYPPDLDTLVEGVGVVNDATGRKLKFLRRVPKDPMTGDTEWGKRSYQDRPDSTSWGGQNVFDVYSLSGGTGLDGTKYSEW